MEQDIKNLIEELFAKMSFMVSDVKTDFNMDSGVVWVSLRTNDSHLLIGKDGETIQHLNHIVRRMVEQKWKTNPPKVTLDINNYQQAKIEKIKTIAHMMAERARFFKSSVELNPMNAFERRIVHEYVSDKPDLSSESVGFGNHRHVVISFVKEKPL